ncbi:MAG: MMPL family transporter [Oscillospiraceae bacterium]|jgi:predicted RND superfamily exporter protein/F0F1-type ATP synthase assembly protein I|nr:MMPL family transporter [Oscillospiraceae bacterium]
MDTILDIAGKTIIKCRFVILALFIIAVGASGALQGNVKINEDMTKYLPSDSETIIAAGIMSDEFGNNETLKVMVKDVPEDKTGVYQDAILNVNGGNTVLKVSQEAYKDNSVLFAVTLKAGLSLAESKEAADHIRDALSDKTAALAGHVVTENYVDSVSGGEAAKLLMILIPILLLILFISSKSFIDPVICLITIIVSIVIGQGTNVIFTDVSSITNNMFAVLMIAISMDYSVFMLHTFKDARDEGLESRDAVLYALKKSFTTISGASLTTIAGFVSFTLMKFAFGADIGWVFAKGILISLLTVLLLMPCLLMFFDKLIRKTSHRDFLPSFKGFGKFVTLIRWAVIPVVLVGITVSVYGSNQNNFIYGNSTLIETPGTILYDDNRVIVDTFGRQNQLVVLLPIGDNLAAENELAERLQGVDNVDSDIISLATVVNGINPDLLKADMNTVYNALSPYLDVNDLHGEHYARMVLNLETPEEGDEAFKAIEDIKAIVPDGAYVIGSTSAALDMKDTINSDYMIVTIVSLLAVGLIVGLSFKSLSLPLLLLLCVQGGVFINMAIPAITGEAIPYVAYILISTIQLGATIDYAILFTGKYMENRQSIKKVPAAIASVHQVSGSLLTSGGVLMAAGFTMFFTSADAVVSKIGMLLGRGAFTSMSLVFIFLPALLIVFDKFVQKTTYKADFLDDAVCNHESFNTIADLKDTAYYAGCYASFGWELSKSKIKSNPSSAIEDRVVLNFKRNVNLANREKLNVLQEKCEISLREIERLEKRKNSLAISVALLLGLLAAGVVVGSVVGFTRDFITSPWVFALTNLLGVLMTIPPAIVYNKINKAKTARLTPQIEKQTGLINEFCVEARKLLTP